MPEHYPPAPQGTARRPWTFLGGIALLIGLVFVGRAVQEWRYEAGSEVVQGIVLDKGATYRTGRGSSLLLVCHVQLHHQAGTDPGG